VLWLGVNPWLGGKGVSPWTLLISSTDRGCLTQSNIPKQIFILEQRERKKHLRNKEITVITLPDKAIKPASESSIIIYNKKKNIYLYK